MIKQKVVNKILKNSGSFNYYKDNYEKLSENLNESIKKINDLENDLKIKDGEIDKLRFILNNIEEGFIFSIVMALYNTEKYLSEAIESVINQTFPFSKVQLILVDDGSSDDSKNICLKYAEKYPDNIKYIYQENQGQATARNNGLRFTEGKFVNFLDSDDKLELNCLEEIYYHFLKFGEEIDVISIPRYTFDAVSQPAPFFEKYSPSRIVDIYSEFNFPITSISSAFVRKDSLLNMEFDKRVIISEDSLMINKIVLDKCKFGAVSSTKYLYRKRIEENSTIDTKKMNKAYYNPRMEFYYKELIRYSIEKYGSVLKYIQSVLISDLRWQFQEKLEKNVLDKEEIDKYYTNIYDILQYLDEDVINSMEINKNIKSELLNFRNTSLHPIAK